MTTQTAVHVDRSLVLASTSVSRRVLLERLQLPFITVAPMVDENPHPGEAARDLVLRLAEAKARAGALHYPHALIIGSDQVAFIDGQIIGKPGHRDQAIAQLQSVAGRSLQFYNGLCLLDAATGALQIACIPFVVHFRTLNYSQIVAYVDREPAYDCAGSFRSEGLGVALFQRLEGDDPTALLGLPLIRLVAMLENVGVFPVGC